MIHRWSIPWTSFISEKSNDKSFRVRVNKSMLYSILHLFLIGQLHWFLGIGLAILYSILNPTAPLSSLRIPMKVTQLALSESHSLLSFPITQTLLFPHFTPAIPPLSTIWLSFDGISTVIRSSSSSPLPFPSSFFLSLLSSPLLIWWVADFVRLDFFVHFKIGYVRF